MSSITSELIGAANTKTSKRFEELGGPWKLYFYACCDILSDIHFCHLLVYNQKDEYVDFESLPEEIQESSKGLTEMLKAKVYLNNKIAIQEGLEKHGN